MAPVIAEHLQDQRSEMSEALRPTELIERAKLRAYGQDLGQALNDAMVKVQKLSDAADLFLTDPEDASRYDLASLRAEDVTVIYYRDGVRSKAILSDLLERIEDKLPKVTGIERIETRRQDTRKFIVDALAQQRGYLEMIGKWAGLGAESRKTSVTVNNYNASEQTLARMCMWMVECDGSWSEAKHYLEPGIPEVSSLPPEPPPGFLDEVEVKRRKATRNTVMP
jgi:hypothetical protein